MEYYNIPQVEYYNTGLGLDAFTNAWLCHLGTVTYVTSRNFNFFIYKRGQK